MKIGVTGHRPVKLGSWDEQVRARLVRGARQYLTKHTPVTELISGMAEGWDTACAIAAVELEIPLIAAVPFQGQEARWSLEAQTLYRDLLARAAEVAVIVPGPGEVWKFQARNQWIVERCDRLLALWNGSDGGTANCIAYAWGRAKPVDNLWSAYERSVLQASRP